MLHHISLGVSSLARAAAFYDAALGALGFVRVWTTADAVGYGVEGGGDKLALKHVPEGVSPPGPRFHLALAAPTPAHVDAFFAAALRHGGQDNGAPGLRPHYGPRYYACFVLDPDGYPLEAVNSGP